jgi:hypothetical protein
MLINKIDELFDSTLNNFFDFLYKKDTFKKLSKDSNFVVYHEDILFLIKDFIKTINLDKYINIKNESYIKNIIKRYCVFYIYLGIAYYYTAGLDLFITNIIESSKNQKDSIIQIENFFNSENNSKLISFFNIIQNIKSLVEFKTMDKIKIIIDNNPIKFSNIKNIIKELGEDYISNNFIIKDNFHNILKTIIFKFIYLNEEKVEINKIINDINEKEGEYKYIEVIVANKNKLVDFNFIQKLLNIKQLKSGLAEDIYNYLSDMINYNNIILRENKDFINYLFVNKILVPISEDFIRYHKDSEKYESEKIDDTKIKFIINKLINIKNYYSPMIKNNIKLKNEIEKYFYKNLDPRMAIVYNDNEEIKIIQKLIFSEVPSDYDNLIQLQDIRKYAYVNFKNTLTDSIKLRPLKTIDSVRLINLKKKKNETIETRIGNSSIGLNVVGVIFNPSRINVKKTQRTLTPLECYTRKDLINVNDLTKKDNGFLSFIKVLNKYSEINSNNLYYWLFDNKKDIPKLNKYLDYNKNDSENNFKIMLAEIYEIWINIIENKFNKYLDSIKFINNWELEKLIKIYENKYFNLDFSPDVKNNLIYKALTTKLKKIKTIEDPNDNIIPGKREKIIKLPIADIKVNNKNIVIIKKNKQIIEENIITNSLAICNHYIVWSNIKKMSKKEEFNQLIFEFVKKYVRVNEKGDFICKSCNEMVSLNKYVYEGTYVKELDQFMTTSIAVNEKLSELPKYNNLKRTINNLGKNIEKIAYLLDYGYFLGNDNINKLHRKTLIKDIIDLILLHTEYLRKQPKNRIELTTQKYNIKFTNLFFFELKDEIFLTSSTDTDYYKLIKYNNVIIYLLFLMINELNSGQILNFKNDKRCNYFFFSKINEALFKDLKLRINEKEVILIIKIPLLCYIIYYFSCIIANNKLWLYNETNEKDNIVIQKTIIHTLIDLINTIIEANLETNKNYFYEMISRRFMNKLTYTFNDNELLKRIDININKKILYDDKTKKYSFISKRIIYIPIDSKFTPDSSAIKEYCNNKTKFLNKVKFKIEDSNINSLTNCEDGNFHVWQFNDNIMTCKLCNKKYFDLIKIFNKNKIDTSYYDKLKLLYIKKLTDKYCLNGEMHQIDINTGVCNLCKINPNTYKYSNKELSSLEKILDNKNNIIILENINTIKMKEKEALQENELNNKILNKFESRFKDNVLNKYSSNFLENYVTDFIEKIINILGKKITINNKTIYLKDTKFSIDHDYLGNKIKNIFTVLSSENIIQYQEKHPYFKKDILFYKDKANKIYVYYDQITLQYLGYSEDNKNIKTNKNNANIIVEYSIKDQIMLLGLENTYTNLYHLDSTLINNFKPNNKNIMDNLVRNRINNLKQLSNRIKSIIYTIRNHGSNNSIYNQKEKTLINEFKYKLKDFNIKGVFKNSINICNQLNLKPFSNNIKLIFNDYYLKNDILNTNLNSDSKLIYFIIMNLNRLLDYNDLPAIKSELAYLIIKIIQYANDVYFIDTSFELRKLEYLIFSDSPYIDEKVRPIGLYQELVNGDIEDEILKEKNYDAQEEFDALDIDDYDQDDDIDGKMEALDGDIDT